jgi:sugar lactone lactonase YvrE
MKTRMGWIVTALLALALAAPAGAWNRNPATTFATLPAGATTPEGITVDSAGNVYVTTFGFPDSGPAAKSELVVFSPNGKLLRQVTVSPASAHLLGLAFHPITGDLLVLDFGAGKVLNVDPQTGAATVFADIGAACGALCVNPLTCETPSPPGPGLNALTFDASGNVYISDSFSGIIWQTAKDGSGINAWASDPLLATCGKPPFGANGIAFNNEGTAMFVANTGDDSVVKIPVVSGGAAGAASVLAYSINGADGLIIDASDNIWVCANQSDEIVVLNSTGKVIAKLGDFNGIDNQGAARGLLFPASLVFSGNFVLVTNLALDLGTVFGIPTVDSQWAAQITQYTVSKISRNLAPSSTGGGRGR